MPGPPHLSVPPHTVLLKQPVFTAEPSGEESRMERFIYPERSNQEGLSGVGPSQSDPKALACGPSMLTVCRRAVMERKVLHGEGEDTAC